jgi:hypothetical protein
MTDPYRLVARMQPKTNRYWWMDKASSTLRSLG